MVFALFANVATAQQQLMRKLAKHVVAASSYCGDADADAFLSVNIGLTTTQKDAICTLVASAKTNGWWDLATAIYPFVGGSVTAHKWNLKDARDLDAAYRLLFVNQNGHSWTHNPAGIKGEYREAPGGTYANTYITANDLPQDSVGIVISCSVAGTQGPATDFGAIAAESPPYPKMSFIADHSLGFVADMWSQNDNRIIASPGGTTGVYAMTRDGQDLKVYRNSFRIGSNGAAATGYSSVTFKIFIGAGNDQGNPILSSDRTYNFFIVGKGLSEEMVVTITNDINTFNTAIR